MQNTGNHKLPFHTFGNLINAFAEYRGIIHFQRIVIHFGIFVSSGIMKIFLLLFQIHLKEITNHDNRQYNAYYGKRIGHGITHGDTGIAFPGNFLECLLGGTEARSIGNGSGQYAHHGSYRQTRNHMNRTGDRYA